ncbi:galactose mutarotase-like protein [Lepidopterella palustris CBS 459.81]|uniref:Galactose mutarotase-like protein n=1 Tax=Lepidopterella palustris CBS 459.81 TaxID=1314670 RepID=A0A8E2ELI1_9PEZI|nr:galactose mutarotase-like protein [Lepidopterella palustris CBS 459.81]
MSSPDAFSFLPLGAIIQEFRISGQNIVQNFPDPELYKQHNSPYFGETIGRIANRVSGAKINDLNGKSYQLAANNGPNSLHGGNVGWGKREFKGPTRVTRHGSDSILFEYTSPDGEEGYPGTVEVRVWYTQSKEQENSTVKIVLEVEYEAELAGEGNVKETAIGMTNHSYFNLIDAATISGTEVTLATNKYQVVDFTGIPTGPIEEYPGILSNKTFTLGQEQPDIDNCFIMNTDPTRIPVDTRSLPIQKLAAFYHPDTKLHLEILSTEPAFQFYTGKYIDVPAVDGVQARGPRSGFCVEPSRYVNAINVPEQKGMVVLKKGQTYGSRSVYRGWKA